MLIRVGAVIAGRFELVREAAQGGIGTVFEARDRSNGERVAIKLLRTSEPEHVRRFEREAKLLAELEDPGFVRYLASGVVGRDEPYLVTEWLRGEDLDARLERGPLSISDAIALLDRVTRSLARAHERGIIHRDIKPSNLWLVDGDIHAVKILDLGLARFISGGSSSITRTGAVMGTPSYMSPEQVRGASVVDPRSDVFSLGCVLYESLTGCAAYSGEHVMAVLAKIVFEDAPRVRSLRPDVPLELDRLVRAMLSRDPQQRPANSSAINAELQRLVSHQASTRKSSGPPPALTETEQKVLCVLIANTKTGDDPYQTSDDDGGNLLPEHEALRTLAAQHGGRLELLANGCLIATFSTGKQATDLAVQAAHMALALRALIPELAIALATGRAVVGSALSVGEAVERAAKVLEKSRAGEIVVDELTRSFVESRFLLHGDTLLGERDLPAAERLLLGKATACVGRDWELGMLEAAWTECKNDRVARVVLVTAPAGMGKSRLRHEFLRRQAKSVERVWVGLGDPMRAGAPLGLLAQALRSCFALDDSWPLADLRQALARRVAESVAELSQRRVTEFLGELCGVPFAAEQSVELAAARLDPILMGDQTLRAWEDWLSAESARQPIILVFEDMHWGDLPTVKFVDSALRELHDRPIFVLALGRPEMHDQFPNLWAERGATEFHLRQLSRRSCEHLVRQVLGDSTDAGTVARLVEHAEGNVFYLEELIRAVSEGRSDLPSSVVAMLQVRLLGLPDSLRFVLRAASIMGGQFEERAVSYLMDPREQRPLAHELGELVNREWLSRSRQARAAGAPMYRFRHELVREAAYATLTDADRILGHRLAADWLESSGETEAIIIAEHCARAGDNRAIGWYQRAAEQALEGSDLAATIARARQAELLGAEGATLGALKVLEAEAHNWRSDWQDAERCGELAMMKLAPGSPSWAHAVHQRSWAACQMGGAAQIAWLADTLLSHPHQGSFSRMHALAHANMVVHSQIFNCTDKARALLASLTALTADSSDPIVTGVAAYAFGSCEMDDGKLAQALESFSRSSDFLSRAGDNRRALISRLNLAAISSMLGRFEPAIAHFADIVSAAQRNGARNQEAGATVHLAYCTAHVGAMDEAIRYARLAVSAFERPYSPVDMSWAKTALSRILFMASEFAAAEKEAEEATATALTVPYLGFCTLACRAQALAARGELDRALSFAEQAVELLAKFNADTQWDAFPRLVHAEVLRKKGRTVEARQAILAARERLLARAALIDSAELRDSFLVNVPDHARTLEFSARYL